MLLLIGIKALAQVPELPFQYSLLGIASCEVALVSVVLTRQLLGLLLVPLQLPLQLLLRCLVPLVDPINFLHVLIFHPR